MRERCLFPMLFHWAIVSCVFLAMAECQVYTSSQKVMDMVSQEEQMLQDLHVDVLKLGGGQKLLKFSDFYLERLSVIKKRDIKTELERLSHPNGYYLCIKEFSNAYQYLRDFLEPSSLKSLEQHLNLIASNVDVWGAQRALLRLQEVYGLKALDMANGNYSGYLGPALGCDDALDVARRAFSVHYFERASEWANFTFDLMSTSTDGPSFSENCPPESSVLAFKGRALLRTANIEEAKQLYTTAAAQDSKNPDVVELGQELSQDVNILLDHTATIEERTFKSLCAQGVKLRQGNFDPRLTCSYRPAKPPYLRFKQELISVSPYVALFYDVISDTEGDYIKSVSKDKLTRGRTCEANASISSNTREHRTSDVCFLRGSDSSITTRIGHRIGAITGLETSEEPGVDYQYFGGEQLQVVNYGMGGHYAAHMDTFSEPQKRSIGTWAIECGNRMATFLIYLSEVEKGGSTAFPLADIAVAPVKNMALLWYSWDPAGKLDEKTLHAGCPVMVGKKWVSNKWIWSHKNTFTRRCGLTVNATQLDIDHYMIHGW